MFVTYNLTWILSRYNLLLDYLYPLYLYIASATSCFRSAPVVFDTRIIHALSTIAFLHFLEDGQIV